MSINGPRHTTAVITLVGALLSVLLIVGQTFLWFQQENTNSTVNDPKTGQLHVHGMLHDANGENRITLVDQRIDLLIEEIRKMREEQQGSRGKSQR